MHGLIFETSVWLLAESTRLLLSTDINLGLKPNPYMVLYRKHSNPQPTNAENSTFQRQTFDIRERASLMWEWSDKTRNLHSKVRSPHTTLLPLEPTLQMPKASPNYPENDLVHTMKYPPYREHIVHPDASSTHGHSRQSPFIRKEKGTRCSITAQLDCIVSLRTAKQ